MVGRTIYDYLERIKRLYNLIKMEKSGNRRQIAERMRLSERTVANYISELKSMGAVINYDIIRNTYYFSNDFTLEATFHVSFSEVKKNN